MHGPIYREAMVKAWHLVWHNKILWIFGLLSVMVGQFGLGDFVGKFLYWNDRLAHPFYVFPFVRHLAGVLPFGIGTTMGVVWAGLITLLLMGFMAFVSVSAQGVLVAGVADWYKTKKTDKLSLAWHKGVEHFWRLLGVNIIEKMAFGALLFVLAASITYLRLGGMISLGLMGLVFAVVFFLAFAVAAISIYAIGYIVVENRDMFDAYHQGAKLFVEHLLVSIELSILLFFVGWIVLAGVFLWSFIAFLPSVFMWLIGASFGSVALMWLGLIIGMVFLAAVFVIAGGLFNAFTVSAWIYCFMKMKHTGIASRLAYRIERLFHL
ncbi:MAG: hypothetical protein WCT40_03100 [Candidatus Magasanikbacteria bacterium]|jgi:hypothetical protein